MFLAGRNDAGRAPQVLAPFSGGPLSETSASRHLRWCQKRQQGVAPELRLERLPMSTRNGTSSSVNPQPD